MIVRVPTIVVKLEGGVGRRTVPLLITEMTFEGEVRDWSGKVSFYNTGKQLHGPVVQSTAKDSHIFSTKNNSVFVIFTFENLMKR